MITIQQASESNLNKIVFVFESNRKSMLYIPKLHTHKENIEYFKSCVKNGSMYIGILNKKVIGFIDITQGYIHHLYVDQEFHNQGVGKLLLDFAKSKNNHLHLWVFEDNKEAIRFYEREGFMCVEKRDKSQTDNEEKLADRKYIWKKS